MARDLFNRQVELGEPLAADATILTLPGALGEEDQLVQQMSIQYQQNVNRLWEVGSFKTFFIAGRTQGSMQVKRVVGSKGVNAAFVKQYADVCKIKENHFSLSFVAGCESGSDKGSLSVEGVVITSIAYNVAAADMIINEDISFLFAMLTYG
jgi:hypothetical protein